MPRASRYAQASSSEPKSTRSIYRISPQTSSPLFKLPLELRNAIWELALPHSVRPRLPSIAPAATFPRCCWQPAGGNLDLLRACKRMNTEGTRVFYATNVFDCVVDSPEPYLVVAYRNPDEWISLSARLEASHSLAYSDMLNHKMWKGKRKLLSRIKREHSALIRNWVLNFPTHLGLDFEQQRNDALDHLAREHWILWVKEWTPEELLVIETTTIARFADMRAERKAYCLRVLFGFDRWLQLSRAKEVVWRDNHLELIFYRYFDCAGRLDKPDEKLTRTVLQALPPTVVGQDT